VAAAVIVVLVAIVTVVLIAGNGDSSSTERARPGAAVLGPGAPDVGEVAPDFTAPALDGGEVRLSDYRGRPVVVNFWASWCNPCRKEFPLLAAARAKHRDDGLEVIGVSYRDIPSDARAFARSRDARWLLARDDRGVIAGGYGVRAIPQTFFIDREGKVAARVFGITSVDDLESTLKPILRNR
jgi:cytochrome c biogenesis protein CcmG, thiol:disulfide interchange protein DsbE